MTCGQNVVGQVIVWPVCFFCRQLQNLRSTVLSIYLLWVLWQTQLPSAIFWPLVLYWAFSSDLLRVGHVVKTKYFFPFRQKQLNNRTVADSKKIYITEMYNFLYYFSFALASTSFIFLSSYSLLFLLIYLSRHLLLILVFYILSSLFVFLILYIFFLPSASLRSFHSYTFCILLI